MVVISKSKLMNFYDKDPKAKERFLKWYNITSLSDWQNFHSIKEDL